MRQAESKLQDKSADDNVSQGSKREFKRFKPVEVDEKSLTKKKLTLAEYKGDLLFVHSKSKSKHKDLNDSQVSTPVASLNRNSSHTILRSNKQQEKKGDKPPLAPKNVRFTFGRPLEVVASASQLISKATSQQSLDPPSNVGYSTITDQLDRNFGGEWRQPDSNLQSDGQYDVQSRTEALNSPRAAANYCKERELELEIQKYRTARKIFLSKIRDLKQLQTGLVRFVKDTLMGYEAGIAELSRNLTIKFDRQLRNWQAQAEARLQSRLAAESGRRVGQENNRTFNTFNTDKIAPMPCTPTGKVDHSNIMEKLDKIKFKLDEMTKIKEDLYEESTSATLSSMEPGSRDQLPPRRRMVSQLNRVTSIQQFKQMPPE